MPPPYFFLFPYRILFLWYFFFILFFFVYIQSNLWCSCSRNICRSVVMFSAPTCQSWSCWQRLTATTNEPRPCTAVDFTPSRDVDVLSAIRLALFSRSSGDQSPCRGLRPNATCSWCRSGITMVGHLRSNSFQVIMLTIFLDMDQFHSVNWDF